MLIKSTKEDNPNRIAEHACAMALVRKGWDVKVTFNKATATKLGRMEVLTARTFRALINKCCAADAAFAAREKKRK